NVIFDPLHVAVEWSGCGGDSPRSGSVAALPITMRVLHQQQHDARSGDAMGMAFTSDGQDLQADVYYDAIKELAGRKPNDPAEALAYVIAHEIGHLFLGPGHVKGTIMCTEWTSRILEAAERRQLTFNSTQRAALRRELLAKLQQGDATRTAAPPPD